MEIAAVVMSIMLAVLILGIGAAKVFKARFALANAEHLGFSTRAYQAIGGLEVAAAVGLAAGLAWAPVGIAAAVGLVALLVGAVVVQRRAGDGVKEMAPAVWFGLVSAATAVVIVVAM